jgi:hypothetical protein
MGFNSAFKGLTYPSAFKQPVPVAALSKAQFCGRSPAEIVGSTPTGAWMFGWGEWCMLVTVL